MERRRHKWNLLIQWVLASTLGWTIGLDLALAVSAESVVVGAFVGTTVGISQWLVLRRHVPLPWWWIPSSAIGSAAATVVGAFVGFPFIEVTDFSLGFALPSWLFPQKDLMVVSYVFGGPGAGAIVGAGVGLIQRIAFRRLLRPGPWVLSSTAGFAVGFAVASWLSYVSKELLIVGLSAGAIVGTITGFPLFVIPRALPGNLDLSTRTGMAS